METDVCKELYAGKAVTVLYVGPNPYLNNFRLRGVVSKSGYFVHPEFCFDPYGRGEHLRINPITEENMGLALELRVIEPQSITSVEVVEMSAFESKILAHLVSSDPLLLCNNESVAGRVVSVSQLYYSD